MDTDYKSQLIRSLRPIDPELSEDLFRRMPEINDLSTLRKYFHRLLAQYPMATMDLRAGMEQHQTFESWYVYFRNNIVPVLMERRLPPCTDTMATSAYTCRSANIG
jgi:hypothetical protein